MVVDVGAIQLLFAHWRSCHVAKRGYQGLTHQPSVPPTGPKARAMRELSDGNGRGSGNVA